MLPRHIGIIMDGNGRWANKRGLPRTAGHKKAAEVFGDLVRYCRDIGVEILTVYAFSTENWKRPQEEIRELMNILRKYLNSIKDKNPENSRILFLGDRAPLDEDLRRLMEDAERSTRENTGFTTCIAINYGGRNEILHAVKRIAQQVKDGRLAPADICEETVERYLYTSGLPDPDLIIRTSGEVRTSNFLTWQSAYSEYVFSDVLWPDFTPDDLDRAIEDYARRSRRFGGV